MKSDDEYKAMLAGWDMCLTCIQETRHRLPMHNAIGGVMKGTLDSLISTLRKQRDPSIKALWEARQQHKNSITATVEVVGRSDP